MSNKQLSVVNHDRDSAQLTYIYPVVSRRAGGVSLGVNLNPNNACNFRCIYCQVPELVYGKGPTIDMAQFEAELRLMLQQILHGDFMQERVPEGNRFFKDVAFSGNGEPTSSPQFKECVELLSRVLKEVGAPKELKTILITNGTLTDRPAVAGAIQQLATMNGELWFKLDSATAAGAERINSTKGSLQDRIRRLSQVAWICPTWVQSCWFKTQGQDPSVLEVEAFVQLLSQLKQDSVPLRGVLLYGLARPSMQAEAPDLAAVEASWLEAFGRKIQDLGLEVRISL